MTDKEKLEKLKKLADAMYDAAQYLTTDASRLHKAMDEYRKFIIYECKEEPVSEELGQAAITAADEDMQGRQIMEESNENRQLYSRIFRRGFKAGAKWQEKQDQSTIELAEDHAMLAGMNKMEEQMMAKAIDAHCFGFQGAALFTFRLPAGSYLVGSKVKVIVIKED